MILQTAGRVYVVLVLRFLSFAAISLHHFLMKAACPSVLNRARGLARGRSRYSCIGGIMVSACSTSMGVALKAPAIYFWGGRGGGGEMLIGKKMGERGAKSSLKSFT